jgi:hypothetical protein
MTRSDRNNPKRKKRMNSTLPAHPPPPHRSVRSFAARHTGRPPVWSGLLKKFLGGSKVKKGPYKNEPTAVAAAGWFNAQMRSNAPTEYEKGFRFRGRGVYVIVKRIDL